MINSNGKFLNATMSSLNLDAQDKQKAITNAEAIVTRIVTAYESVVGAGHVGQNANGIPTNFTRPDNGAIGLVYGRIQSGKTRAMIASTAMAFDNGFRIAVVMTSNINDLVTQTHGDFTKDLRGVSVFTKDDELDKQVDDAKIDIARPEGRILLIASKGTQSLKNISSFLKKIGAELHPMIIFDDEGDQGSLDTNVFKRSKTGDLSMQPSPINNLIGKIRKDFAASVYVSVTGTPQAVLLQSSSSKFKPSFVHLLPHGDGYVGGDHFFEADPDENNNRLISIIPAEDKADLLNSSKPIPTGLKNSLLFFLLAAAAAVKNLGSKDKGYQFLCHPSLKNNEQDTAKDRIATFLTEVKKTLIDGNSSSQINNDLASQYASLKQQLGDNNTPALADLKQIILDELVRKKILVINAQNQKRKGIEYGPGFNFLIGGNTLGRGIAIPNLLVTYYVRAAKTSQIDTMHQHARMFGYRKKTLAYTRLFITRDLFHRFQEIHYSDQGLREFIEKYKDTFSTSYPVEVAVGLRATRPSVLDVNTTESVWPGMQIYPNYMTLPQPKKIYDDVMKSVAKKLGPNKPDVTEMVKKGKSGVTISADEAIEIISAIKTKSKNAWHDKTISDVITKLTQRLGSNVILKFREANRRIDPGGFLGQGTLFGGEHSDGRNADMPTLWIMSVTGKSDSTVGAGEQFVFPTIIVPDKLANVFVFNKK